MDIIKQKSPLAAIILSCSCGYSGIATLLGRADEFINFLEATFEKEPELVAIVFLALDKEDEDIKKSIKEVFSICISSEAVKFRPDNERKAELDYPKRLQPLAYSSPLPNPDARSGGEKAIGQEEEAHRAGSTATSAERGFWHQRDETLSEKNTQTPSHCQPPSVEYYLNGRQHGAGHEDNRPPYTAPADTYDQRQHKSTPLPREISMHSTNRPASGIQQTTQSDPSWTKTNGSANYSHWSARAQNAFPPRSAQGHPYQPSSIYSSQPPVAYQKQHVSPASHESGSGSAHPHQQFSLRHQSIPVSDQPHLLPQPSQDHDTRHAIVDQGLSGRQVTLNQFPSQAPSHRTTQMDHPPNDPPSGLQPGMEEPTQLESQPQGTINSSSSPSYPRQTSLARHEGHSMPVQAGAETSIQQVHDRSNRQDMDSVRDCDGGMVYVMTPRGVQEIARYIMEQRLTAATLTASSKEKGIAFFHIPVDLNIIKDFLPHAAEKRNFTYTGP